MKSLLLRPTVAASIIFRPYSHFAGSTAAKPLQYNTIQYNTIQYNTIQYNTIQYNTCSGMKPDPSTSQRADTPLITKLSLQSLDDTLVMPHPRGAHNRAGCRFLSIHYIYVSIVSRQHTDMTLTWHDPGML
jgi:hypothetical protein